VFGSSKNEFVDTPATPQLQKSELVLFQEVYSALYQSFTEDVEEEVNEKGETVPIKKGRTHKNKVLLSTIHSSKGGQADYVLYCGLALFNAVQEDDEVSEACCNYVALTRAKKRLYISHANTVEGFDGVPKRSIPNPFFKQTLEHIQDMVREKQQQARLQAA
jgi:superfamily I DNA/RNA helicase